MADEHNGHRQREKERFLATGLTGFAQHEALEFILFYAIPRRDTNAIAHRLIAEFGSFDGVVDASYERLMAVEGVGKHAALLIKLVGESMRYYLREKAKDIRTVRDERDCFEIARSLMLGLANECVYVVCVDDRMAVLNTVKVSEGSVNAVSVTIKGVADAAMRSNASGVILMHNHPAGSPVPTAEDLRTTAEIMRALKSMSIKLHDHIIIAPADCCSLRRSGVFTSLEREE